MAKLGAIVLLLAGLVGLYLAGGELLWQDRLVRRSKPVHAIMIVSAVPGAPGKGGGTFSPVVRYRYSVDAQTMESTRVWPYRDQMDADEARIFLQRFPAGADITAYVDPADPTVAVLVRQYSSMPYWGAAGALLVLWSGARAFLQSAGRSVNKANARTADACGRFLLRANVGLRDGVKQSWLLLLLTGLPMAALAVHLVVVMQPVQGWGAVFVAFALLMLAGAIIALWWASKASSYIGDPRLSIRPMPLQRGEDFSVNVEVDIYRALPDADVVVHVICLEHALMHTGRFTQFVKKIVSQKSLHVLNHVTAAAGSVLAGSGVLQFDPAETPASGQRGITMYPRYTWEARVELAGTRKFVAIFPLEVH
jgi:hypothetical protein